MEQEENEDVEHKTAKKQDESQALTVESARSSRGTQKVLDAALAYSDELKPTSVHETSEEKEQHNSRVAAAENLSAQVAMLYDLMPELGEKSQGEVKIGIGMLVKRIEALPAASLLVSLR